jgi:hypothetical protein
LKVERNVKMKLFSLSLQQRLARWGMVLVVVMASTALTSQPAQASQSHPVENHCISPTTGVDLNVLFGTTKQIITPFCNQVDSGEQWTAAGPAWLVATSLDAVPEGFVPAGATPLEDFLAKFVGVKYVLDSGTLQERTYFYPNGDKIWTGIIDVLPSVWPGTLSIASPLSIGTHVVEVYWVFSAMHCDGLAAVIEENCLGLEKSIWYRPEYSRSRQEPSRATSR